MRLIQSGPRDAKVVAVGESPGKTEEATGKPFVGWAGEQLDKAIAAANRYYGRIALRHEDIFITNLAHVRPPGDEFDWFLKPKMRPELMLGVLQLKKDLEEIRPNLVIALGGQPLRFLSNKAGITKWRGSIVPCTLVPGLKVIATFHPSSLRQVFDNHGLLHADMIRCVAEMEYPDLRLPKRDHFIDPLPDVREAIVSEMLKAEWLAVDIETTKRTDGLWEIDCVGFSDKPERSLILPYEGPERKFVIKQLCECPAKKVFQNGQYDISVLQDWGIIVNNVQWDIMYGHHALYPEAGGSDDEMDKFQGKKRQVRSALVKRLELQTSIYTREPFYKDDGDVAVATGDTRLRLEYCGKDCAVTNEIRGVQEKELKEFGTTRVFEHEMKLQPILMHMTRRGFPIDVRSLQSLRKMYEEEITRLQDFLDKGAGRSINVKSPDVKWLLFDKLGLKPTKTSEKTGKPSADKFVVEALNAKYHNPLLSTILEIRGRRDLIERYLDVRLDADNRWRATYDPTGTRTGRLASRGTIYGTGNNILNIPEKVRRMFVAEEGKILFALDLSQAEARVVAWLARCEALINLFESGQDIHSINAKRFFDLDCPDEEVKKHYDGLRYASKRIVHGSNYGEQPPRIVESSNDDARRTGMPHRLTLPVAEKGQRMYFMLYPEIRDNFWREVRDDLYRTRTLDTPFGRKRQFFGRWDEKLLNQAYAYKPQSAVGDAVEIAMIDLWDFEKGLWKLPNGAEILSNGYDSLIGQCNIGDEQECLNIVGKAMSVPMVIFDRELRIPSDSKVGHNWGRHSDDNPLGMKEIK